MTKSVLNVGQCGLDHSAISRFLGEHFDVEVRSSQRPADTLAQLGNEEFDLVLVNRKLDTDSSDGVELIRAIKADPRFADLPVMLVSNYETAHAAAIADGAEYGFGKAQCGSPEVVRRLANFLQPVQ
jgi:two-component system chemotaxis response regulator CheY